MKLGMVSLSDRLRMKTDKMTQCGVAKKTLITENVRWKLNKLTIAAINTGDAWPCLNWPNREVVLQSVSRICNLLTLACYVGFGHKPVFANVAAQKIMFSSKVVKIEGPLALVDSVTCMSKQLAS